MAALLCLGAPLAAQEPAANPLSEAAALERPAPAPGESEREAYDTDLKALEASRAHLQSIRATIRGRIASLESEPATTEELEQARVDLEAAKLERDGLVFVLDSVDRQLVRLREEIEDATGRRQLLENPATPMAAGKDREDELQKVRETLLDLDVRRKWLQSRKKLFAQHLGVAEAQAQALTKWVEQLSQSATARQQIRRITEEAIVGDRLESEVKARVADVETLTQRLADPELGDAERQQLESQIKLAQAESTIALVDARLGAFNTHIARVAGIMNTVNVPAKDVRAALSELEVVLEELDRGQGILERNIDLLERRKNLIAQQTDFAPETADQLAEDMRRHDAVITELKSRLLQIQDGVSRASTLQENLQLVYEERLRASLLTRRTLPDTPESLRALVLSVSGAPRILFNQGLLSLEFASDSVLAAGYNLWLRLGLALLALVWFGIWFRRATRHALRALRVVARSRDRFSDDVSMLALSLVHRLAPLAIAVMAVMLIVYLTDVKQPGRGIILTVASAILVGETVRVLAWILLKGPHAPVRNPRLYRGMTVMLWLAGIAGTLAITGILAGLRPATQDVLDRLVMLVVLLSVWPFARMRSLILGLLVQAYAERRWFVIARFVSLGAVLTLAAMALIGLVGYVELAWRIGIGLGAFVVVVALWLTARGLLDDVVVWLKNVAVTHTDFGLLWTQDVINPLHKTADVGLVLAAAYFLVDILGPEQFRFFEIRLWDALGVPLFSLGQSTITLWHILVIVGGLWLIFRFSGWVRSITYRWVYSRVVDLGVRNSLAVFTQYAIVVIGVLAVLNTLGLDLTTFTVFAGALGVGLGLGLQNIANNFVSGILLLVERPLRTGDWVQIGEGDGQVSRIGMRSLSVKTWDNQEIIIPNADVISNSFTNWTRSDTILRTVLYLGVSYDANPHAVKGLMLEVLERHSQVLDEPPPAVFLWEFADSSVNFRVQYFCDTGEYGLLRLRSEVLFGIWDTLAKHGIEIPYPQRDLHVKTLPAGLAVGLPSDPQSDPQPGPDGLAV